MADHERYRPSREESEPEEQGDRRDRAERIDELADNYDQELDEPMFPALDEGHPPPEDPKKDLAQVRPVVGVVDTTPESQKMTMRLEIPFRTIMRVILTIGVLWALMQISGILVQLLVAFLLATAMIPLVRRLETRGLGRTVASLIVFFSVILLIVAIFWVIVPRFVDQVQNLVSNWSEYQTKFRGAIAKYPALVRQYDALMARGKSTGSSINLNEVLLASTSIASKVVNGIFVLTVTFYLMIEGPSSWKFIARYLTPQLRFRMRRSYPEISRVMSGYVVGQAITSLAFGVFCWIVLRMLDVPEAMLLAVLAALADAVPIVGVFIATAPAVAMALTVNTQAAIIVLVAYTIYQQFENYILAPRVFGNTLQVSALSIMVGILIGGKLLGPVGVMIALPITAVIPALERVWNDPLPNEVQLAEEEEQEAAHESERQQQATNRPRGRRVF